MLYECHITLNAEDADKATALLDKTDMKWKTSKIDGDPVLGKKIYFYLTTHAVDYSEIHQKMSRTAAVLYAGGLDVVRQKIEAIVFDTKVGICSTITEADGITTISKTTL